VGWTTQWHTVIPFDYLGLALVVSLSLGLFFGVYPVRRASLLLPIGALRAE
jgi:putative ABC transport system permease protein